MNVLYLSDIRFPLERANGIQTMETCAALAGRGHRVALLVRPDTARPQRDPFSFYGVERDPRFTIEQPVWLGLRVPQAVRRLMYLAAASTRAHRHPRPHIVFTRDLGVAERLLKTRRNQGDSSLARVVYESHGYAPEVSRALPALLSDGPAPGQAKLRRLEARERLVWRCAHGYVTITASLARELTERFGPRGWTATIPDGVRWPGGERPPARLNAKDHAPIVGYAGHLYPWKGVDILIEALKDLPAVRALIIGGHPGENDLSRLQDLAKTVDVRDRIEFTAFVPPSDVAGHLKRADVLVLPNPAETISARYTSPLKLFEYMAAGRPIVAPDLPAIREVLQHGRNGLLVEPGNPHALAAAIATVVGDRELADRLAGCAFREAALYSWQNRARRLEQLFASVLT